jgi:hypothetical protein
MKALLTRIRYRLRYYWRLLLQQYLRICPDCFDRLNVTWAGKVHCPNCGRVV